MEPIQLTNYTKPFRLRIKTSRGNRFVCDVNEINTLDGSVYRLEVTLVSAIPLNTRDRHAVLIFAWLNVNYERAELEDFTDDTLTIQRGSGGFLSTVPSRHTLKFKVSHATTEPIPSRRRQRTRRH